MPFPGILDDVAQLTVRRLPFQDRFCLLGRSDKRRRIARAYIEDILIAATALPVVLPPQEIDGALHSDGAIAASMFL